MRKERTTKKTTALVKKDNIEKYQEMKKEEMSIDSLVKIAIEKNDISIVERVIDLRDRIKAEKAKEEFDQAMKKLQGELPTIKKVKDGNKTNSGSVAFKYAPLDFIVSQVKKIIADNGFNFRFKPEFADNAVKITCIVTHSAGHMTETPVMMPLGTSSPLMSNQQIVGSAITYAERISFCAAFGIVPEGDDNENFLQNEKKKTENEIKFEAAWNEFEYICNQVEKNFTEKEKVAMNTIKFTKESNKLPLKELIQIVDDMKKRYKISSSKSKITMG